MRTTWDLSPLYKSIDDQQIEKDMLLSKKKVSAFVKKWKNNGRYLKDQKVLKEALDDYEKLHATTGICAKPLYYFFLLNTLNQTNNKIKGKLNHIEATMVQLTNDLQFFELNISKVSKKQQEVFLKSPLLKKYKHHLESLFKSAKYLLTDKEEKIFNLTSKTSYSNWVNMVTELLDKQEMVVINEKGKKVTIGYNDISKYLDSTDKKVRNYATKQLNKINSQYAEIAEFEINSVLEQKKINDEYRKISRPDIPRHLDDDIDTEIVDTLIKTVSDHFDISREYYKLKAEKLEQKKLGYSERNVPVVEKEKEYSLKESFSLVERAFKNIDDEFYNIVYDFKKDGIYDIYPKQGKRGGAFCIRIAKNLPTYILLNYNGQVGDVTTLAHESGHGIHYILSTKQNSLNCEYPTSLAEVASTFFEDFALEEILQNADDNLRTSILWKKVNSDISTIFRQVAFYSFEKELHKVFREKGYLSKEEISDIFCKHMKDYLGDSVEEDEAMKNGWIAWSHLRMFFYVYSYASGLLISKALQSMVRDDKKNVQLVKKFLSSGSTKSPKELFGSMGIDISKREFWKKGINEIEKNLNMLY